MNRIENIFPAPAEIPPQSSPAPAPLHAGSEVSKLPAAAAPSAAGNFNPHQNSKIKNQNWEEAQRLANLCEDFTRLMASGSHSLNTAAAALDKSPSWFSGADSMLARYKRGGVAALLAQRGTAGAKASFEVPDWFISSARFFYLISNRTWDRGSMPEAVLRTISLPHLPVGWTESVKRRFLKSLALDELPVCPVALRETILARQKAGRPLVTERIARQIIASPATVRQFRNPTDAALDFLSAPGGLRLWTEPDGSRRLARAGEIMEADDATINFPVCVPWQRDGSDDPCVRKFGVKVARFQWLVAIDAGTSFVTGFSYTARPRSSYRGEDVLSLQRLVVRQHGIPALWRFEQGVWKSKLVTGAIARMGSRLETVYSPHQKPHIEGLFNILWTKLSVQFPDSHVGRFQGEHEKANELLTACRLGHKDPRKHFPLLTTAIAAFHEVIKEKNRTPVNSDHHGRWVPEERWEAEWNPRWLDAQAEWMFAPWIRDWRVRGMLVGGRVPLFEDVSVPFDFSAPWLAQYDGARVRAHFDPADPKCTATLVLAERFNGQAPGEVLGHAAQINETAGYVRLVMGWGDDPAHAGRQARQQANAALRREVRAILPRGQGAASASEERDGLGKVAKIESGITTEASEPADCRPGAPTGRSSPEEIADRSKATEKFFADHPLDFV